MSLIDASLQNYFFWTWKIGNSSVSGRVESPAWSYKLGLDNGWMPTDPRQAAGACGNTSPWNGPLSPSQTGQGGGVIAQTVLDQYAWPPTTINNANVPVAQLPSYTPTGAIPTLPVPSLTSSNGAAINAGTGWANPSDTTGLMVPIPACTYLSPWVGDGQAAPPACAAANVKRDVLPRITQPPSV